MRDYRPIKCLESICRYKERMKKLNETIGEIETELEGSAIPLKADRVIEQPKSKQDRLIAALMDYRDDLIGERALLIESYHQVFRLSDQLSDERYKLIIRYKYIDGMTFREIGETMRYDPGHLCQLHHVALKELSELEKQHPTNPTKVCDIM